MNDGSTPDNPLHPVTLPLTGATAGGYPCHDPDAAAAARCTAYRYPFRAAEGAFVREPVPVDDDDGAARRRLFTETQEAAPPGQVAAQYGVDGFGTLLVPADPGGAPALFVQPGGVRPAAERPPPPARVALDLVRLVATAAHLLQPPCAACGRRPRGYVSPGCGHPRLCGHCVRRLPEPRCPACGRLWDAADGGHWPVRSVSLGALRADPRVVGASRPPALPDGPLNWSQMVARVRWAYETCHPDALHHPGAQAAYATVLQRVLERRLHWARVGAPGGGAPWPRRADVHRPLPAHPDGGRGDHAPFAWAASEVDHAARTVAYTVRDVDPADDGDGDTVTASGSAEERAWHADVVQGVYACARASRWFRSLRRTVRQAHVLSNGELRRECRRAVAWWSRWREATNGTTGGAPPPTFALPARGVLFLALVALEEVHARLADLGLELPLAAPPAALPDVWVERRREAEERLGAWFRGRCLTSGIDAPRDGAVLRLSPGRATLGQVPTAVTWDLVLLELDVQVRNEHAFHSPGPPDGPVRDLVSSTIRAVHLPDALPPGALPLPGALCASVDAICRAHLPPASEEDEVDVPDDWAVLVRTLAWHAVSWYLLTAHVADAAALQAHLQAIEADAEVQQYLAYVSDAEFQ